MIKKPLPLRPTLVTSVILVVVLTVFATGIPTYLNTKKTITLLWDDIAQELSGHVSEHTQNFFAPAPRLLSLTERFVASRNLQLDEPLKILSYCYDLLLVVPNFGWVYYTTADGAFYGAYRSLDSDTIIGDIRIVDNKDTANPTLQTLYSFNSTDHTWTKKSEHRTNYDPRKRPYWAAGEKEPTGTWSEPYLFVYPSPVMGITYTMEQKIGGKFVGFWNVDFSLANLEEFLNSVKIGETGAVAIVSDKGNVIASTHPTRESLPQRHQDQPISDIIQQTWAHFQNAKKSAGPFYIGDYACYVQPLSDTYKLHWKILTMVHEEDFLLPIYQEARLALIVSCSLVLVFAILGALFFGFISKKLKQIAYELHQIGSFKFSSETFSDKVSFIKEVNMMNVATDQMKLGLNSLTKYIPLDLVSKLMLSGHSATLGGEKQEITILFTDLANFTQIAEQTAPDTLLEILGEYFQAMNEIIEKHHGTVDKYVGDSIMAFWGAPTPQADHQMNACKAALAMQEKFPTLWKKMNPEHRVLLKQRIGINSGVAIVGNVGAPGRMDYTAIGDHVNLASRLESLNKFYGTKILIGEGTASAVKDQMLVRPIERVSVKGKAQSSLIYELLGPKTEATPEMLKALVTYEKGLSLFQNRQFAEAAKIFAEANLLFGGNDSVSQILIRQSEEFQRTPPPENWNGTIVMREK